MKIHDTRFAHTLLRIIAFLVGLALRLASTTWNTRLYGDVNLFALTARQFVLTGRLDYPIKYDFSVKAPYLALSTPASQHPPLWPFLGGVVAKVFSTTNTFTVLKYLDVLLGMLLLLAIYLIGRKFLHSSQALILLWLVACSPALVDFSANGSLYILSSLILILASLLLQANPLCTRDAWLGGILCGMAVLTHTSLALLPVIFLVALYPETPIHFSSSPKSKSRIGRYATFLGVFLVCLSPWLIWNFNNFGSPLTPTTSYYLFERLGMLKTTIHGETITTQFDLNWSSSVLQTYLQIQLKALLALSRNFFESCGPFTTFMALVGISVAWQKDRRKLLRFLSPLLVYLLAVLTWATYKYRFLIPVLPYTYLLAMTGFAFLWEKRSWNKWLAGFCLVGSLLWMIPSYFNPVRSLYYGNETAYQAPTYDADEEFSPTAKE